MNFEKLLSEGKIEKINKEEFDDSLAEKDLGSAENSFNSGDYNWASVIAYNSVLRVCRNLMFFLGYRAIGKEHHKNVFKFITETGFERSLVTYFDNIRKQRNNFVYGSEEIISENNARETLNKAKLFVHKIRTFVHKIRTGEENGK